jgi:hypothetical protein
MRPVVSCICITQAVSTRRCKEFSSFQGPTIKLRVAFGILITYLLYKVPILNLRSVDICFKAKHVAFLNYVSTTDFLPVN